jgi:hypothetical protein
MGGTRRRRREGEEEEREGRENEARRAAATTTTTTTTTTSGRSPREGVSGMGPASVGMDDDLHGHAPGWKESKQATRKKTMRHPSSGSTARVILISFSLSRFAGARWLVRPPSLSAHAVAVAVVVQPNLFFLLPHVPGKAPRRMLDRRTWTEKKG